MDERTLTSCVRAHFPNELIFRDEFQHYAYQRDATRVMSQKSRWRHIVVEWTEFDYVSNTREVQSWTDVIKDRTGFEINNVKEVRQWADGDNFLNRQGRGL